MPKKQGIKDILGKLGIDEEQTKAVKNPKAFTQIKDNVVLKEDHTFFIDILMLPKTSQGFRYLLVAVDIATHEFDIEPLKTKKPQEVLQAMEKMFKRKYISKPCCVVATDGGSEFKGEFNKYLYNESILHKTAQKGRHTQMSMVESLNKQLGRLFNGYMNQKEKQIGKRYNEWTDIIDQVRDELNKYRKVDLPENPIYPAPDLSKEPKYKVGDVVYRLLDVPKDALGHDQPTQAFRAGDIRWDTKNPRKIERVLIYKGKISYRYTLEGLKSVSFTESQLKPANKENASKYTIESIIGERTKNKQKEYLIKWKGYSKKTESTWEPKHNLIEDVGESGLKLLLSEYRKSK
jgi:hypothetical protein